ncbi:MAG: IS200/IS605 family transposase [Methanogenium sp.]
MDYKSKNRSKYLLMYHIIFVCKYRRKILQPIDNDLKQSILKIASEYDFEILEMETDKDHIHLLVSSEPKVSTLSIVRLLKQRTTHDMWQSHSTYLRKYYWKEKTLWTDGYFVASVGNVSKITIEKYIREQG